MRKLLAFAILSAGMYAPFSNATVWRLALCESMLTSDLKPFATDHSSLLVSLRDIRIKMDKQAAKAEWTGTGYESIRQSRVIDQIEPIEAAKIRDRLQEIEEALTSSRLDQQIWAMEFRGRSNVIKALNEFTSNYMTLRKEFFQLQSKLKEQHPEVEERRREFIYRHYSTLSLINVLGLASIHYGHGPVALSSAALVLFCDLVSYTLLKVGRSNFNDKQFRRDLAITMLQSLGVSPSQDWFHIHSSHLNVPVEFHKSIYSNEGDREEARMKGYLMNSTISNVVAYTVDLYQQMKDIVKNAGELKRNIYIDQIAFWDKETNEPVWILIYRATRERPTPRKPKNVDTKESREEEFENDWLPEPNQARNLTNP